MTNSKHTHAVTHTWVVAVSKHVQKKNVRCFVVWPFKQQKRGGQEMGGGWSVTEVQAVTQRAVGAGAKQQTAPRAAGSCFLPGAGPGPE